jgi:hypothetical protein
MLKEVNDSKSDEIMDAVTEATTLNQNANNKAFNESLNAINSRTVVVKTDQSTPPKRPIKLPGNKGIDMF